MNKILHITPHLNGGLGRVMLSTLKSGNIPSSRVHHRIAVLESLGPETTQNFSSYIDDVEELVQFDWLLEEIAEADIVQIEWWNHPLIYKLLFLSKFPPCRLIISSHVSGFFRPQLLNSNIFDFSDLFLATTKATKQHPLFSMYSREEIERKLHYVTYPVDLDRFNSFSPKLHKGINIGYVGTLDYSKLHPRFLKMSSDVSRDDIRFIICGVDENGAIEKESYEYRSEIFDFRGYQSDVHLVLEELDIFAYPLNDTHFGSGEQAIIEAMYVGLPVVAFANPAEKEIIRNGETGILVQSEQEYTKAIEYLCENPKKRLQIGKNAKCDIINRLSPDACFKNLEDIYMKLLCIPKTNHKLQHMHERIVFSTADDKCLGAKLFVESLGTDNNPFLRSLLDRESTEIQNIDNEISRVESSLKVKTKGSIFQYLNFFPNDPFLNFWAGLIMENDCNFSKAERFFAKASTTSTIIVGLDKYLVNYNNI